VKSKVLIDAEGYLTQTSHTGHRRIAVVDSGNFLQSAIAQAIALILFPGCDFPVKTCLTDQKKPKIF